MQRVLIHCLIGLIAFTMQSVIADDLPTIAKAATPKPSLDEINQWIRDLNAPEFTRREAATRHLIAAGTEAAEPLSTAAQTSSLEATSRITTILRTWYTSGNDELIEPAEAALEKLVESKNRHIASRAATTLEQFATTIRQDRAIAQIKQLGGTIEESRTIRGLRIAGPDDTRFFMVILGRNWQGGEEGLKYLRRMSGLTTLYLLQDLSTGKILTPGVNQDAVDELRRALPALDVTFRGPAFLGVKSMANVTICRIDEVPPGTPAHRAKIQPGDVVIGFDDKPIESFHDLVKLIGTKQPGDVIKLEVLRGADENEMDALERFRGQPESDAAKEFLEKLRARMGQKLDVTLGEWAAKPQP